MLRLCQAADAFREAHALDCAALGAEHVHTASHVTRPHAPLLLRAAACARSAGLNRGFAPPQATDLGGFGLVLVAQHRWREALPPLQQCQRVLPASLEGTHPHLQAVASALGKCTLEVAREEEQAQAAGDHP